MSCFRSTSDTIVGAVRMAFDDASASLRSSSDARDRGALLSGRRHRRCTGKIPWNNAARLYAIEAAASGV